MFLLIPSLYLASALRSSEEVALADGKQSGPPVDLPATSGSKSTVDGLGTKDAPVDGKDGRPHLGPFVETSAERERKKVKDSDGETEVKKPVPTKLSEGASSKDAAKMPETNDGVMDDPNRTGPKEGTRGTEGGISEKNKDRKGSQLDRSKPEKKPDPPKEVPPLPHSEQGSVHQNSMKDDGKKGKDGASDDKDIQKEKQKELGGLEVKLLITVLNKHRPLLTIAGYRNPRISLKSLMISPILFQIPLPRATP